MLGYFPQIYPGELLYSVLARYHEHMGAPSSIHTMEALFGRRLVVADPDLPGSLNALAERIPSGRRLDVARLIDERTLLSYYTAFQSPSMRKHARHAMEQGRVEGLLLKLGIAAFRVGRVRRLRFCRACLEQMHAWHGEYYWRRDHQLPSVLVCPEHAVPLQESNVALTGCSRHTYVTPSRENCPWHARSLVTETTAPAMMLLLRLSRASADLLDAPGPARTQAGWTAFYRARMQTVGLVYSATRMNQQQLEAGMRRHYGGCLHLLPHVLEGESFSGDWLAAMVRKHRKAIHPLHHLLLQDFLHQLDPNDSPFGAGPWPCLNPLDRRPKRTSITICRQHRNHGHTVGVFACDCGYVYTHTVLADTKTLGPPRFQSYGPLLAPELRRLIRSGCSLREIARQLGLDPKTVVRLANELGMTTPWKMYSAAPRASKIIRPERRSPSACKQVQTPSLSKAKAKAHKDWDHLDQALNKQIVQAVSQIRKQAPPVRVSTAEVERQLGVRGWFAKRKEKLPLAMARLKAVAESLDAFQRRRVVWVIDEIDRRGQPRQPWRVMRQAGLTSRHLTMIRSTMAERDYRLQAVA